MIISFAHKGLQKFFETGSVAGIQSNHKNRLRMQLATLNQATSPMDMNLPGWRLHPLKGHLCDHWAVSVSGNWRLTFRFNGSNVEVVNYQDYH